MSKNGASAESQGYLTAEEARDVAAGGARAAAVGRAQAARGAYRAVPTARTARPGATKKARAQAAANAQRVATRKANAKKAARAAKTATRAGAKNIKTVRQAAKRVRG